MLAEGQTAGRSPPPQTEMPAGKLVSHRQRQSVAKETKSLKSAILAIQVDSQESEKLGGSLES